MKGLLAGVVGPEIRKTWAATVHHSTNVLLKFLGKQAEQKQVGKSLCTSVQNSLKKKNANYFLLPSTPFL